MVDYVIVLHHIERCDKCQNDAVICERLLELMVLDDSQCAYYTKRGEISKRVSANH